MKKWLVCVLALLMTACATALGESALRLVDVEQLPGAAAVQLYINAAETPDEDSLSVVLGDNRVLKPSSVVKMSDTDEGYTTAFCIDVSGTISEEDIFYIRAMLTDFVEQLGPNDFVQIYAIGDGAVSLCGDYTQSAGEVQKALDALPRKARKTFLWECICVAAQDLSGDADVLPGHARIVVFSDGMDDSDFARSRQDALASARAADTPVLAVALNSTETHADSIELQWLCSESGGILYNGAENISDGLDALRRDLDQNYRVTVDVPYEELLNGEGFWTVKQGVARSNGLSCALTTDGVPEPTPQPLHIPLRVNGETAGNDVIRIPYMDEIRVEWDVDYRAGGYTYQLLGPDGSLILQENDVPPVEKTMSISLDGAGLCSEETYRFTISALGVDGGSAFNECSFIVEAIPVEAKLMLGETESSGGAEIVNLPYSAMNGYLSFTWSVRNASSIEGILSLADGTQISAWDLTSDTQLALSQLDIETGVEYIFQLNAVAKNGDMGTESIRFVLEPVDLDVEISVNDQYAQSEVIRLPYDQVRLNLNVKNAVQFDASLVASDGTVLFEKENADWDSQVLEPTQLTADEVYTFAVTATAEDGSKVERQLRFVMDYEMVTQAEMMYEGVAWDLGHVLAVNDKTAEISIVAQGAVERYEFTAVDSHGEDASAILGSSEHGENYAVLDRKTMRPGEVYEITGVIYPRNQSAKPMTLTLQARAPKILTWLLYVGIGAVVLLALILIITLRKDKRKDSGKEQVDPSGADPKPGTDPKPGPGPWRPGVIKKPLRLRLTQEIEGEQPVPLTLHVTGEASIGRSREADLSFIESPEYTMTVSRQQAWFVVGRDGRLYLRPNLDARNSTCVNGEPIAETEELKEGAVITMGSVTLKLNAIENVYDD